MSEGSVDKYQLVVWGVEVGVGRAGIESGLGSVVPVIHVLHDPVLSSPLVARIAAADML